MGKVPSWLVQLVKPPAKHAMRVMVATRRHFIFTEIPFLFFDRSEISNRRLPQSDSAVVAGYLMVSIYLEAAGLK